MELRVRHQWLRELRAHRAGLVVAGNLDNALLIIGDILQRHRNLALADVAGAVFADRRNTFTPGTSSTFSDVKLRYPPRRALRLP